MVRTHTPTGKPKHKQTNRQEYKHSKRQDNGCAPSIPTPPLHQKSSRNQHRHANTHTREQNKHKTCLKTKKNYKTYTCQQTNTQTCQQNINKSTHKYANKHTNKPTHKHINKHMYMHKKRKNPFSTHVETASTNRPAHEHINIQIDKQTIVCCWLLNNMLVYLRDGYAQIILQASTPRENLLIKFSISPSHGILMPDQPVPALTL